MRELREHGEQLLAIVHSHPHAGAQASKLDIEQAQYPDAYYLIVSLNTRGVLEMRAWKISDGSASAVKVTI
jgi:proteasome lid subunit RPN8/RPN11